MLTIYINCVNGDYLAYGSSEDNKKAVLDFLTLHDHEGSTIQLDITDKEKLYSEEVYKYLKEII